MPLPNWYNENEYRDYPFLTRTEPLTFGEEDSSSSAQPLNVLPHEAIVDFGAIMDIDSGFDESLGHYVYLYAISRAGDVLSYDFRTNAPLADNERCVFTRTIGDDGEFAIEWVDSTSIDSASLDSVGCATESRWRAFMVSGLFADLDDMLGDDETMEFAPGLWQVEFTRIQSLLHAYLRSISLANYPRQQVSEPSVCASESSEAAPLPILNAICLRGNLAFKEGYNCTIRQEDQNNAIIIGAGRGAGAGEPCDEVPIHEDEVAPIGSPHLTGGPGCNEIIKTLNGKGGRNMTIVAGRGFRVFADPEEANTLVVDRELQDFAVCFDNDDESASSESLGE